jgi:hypothetical protein
MLANIGLVYPVGTKKNLETLVLRISVIRSRVIVLFIVAVR